MLFYSFFLKKNAATAMSSSWMG